MENEAIVVAPGGNETMVVTPDGLVPFTPSNIGLYPEGDSITFVSPETPERDVREVIKITKEGFHYNGQYIADAGEAHALLLKVLRICV